MLPLQEIRNFLTESVTLKYGDAIGEYANTIIDLHLDPKNFTMHKSVDSDAMLKAILRGDDAGLLRANIEFENIRQIQGICRVMVRTHLNRQGVSDFTSRGGTLSPIILDIFEDEFNPERYLNWNNLIEDWLNNAQNRINDENNLFYSENIEFLAQILNSNTKDTEKNKQIKSWKKIGPGVFSGFFHLNNLYELKAEKIQEQLHQVTKNGLDAVKQLIKKTQSPHIREYGYALASSFWADLGLEGSESFVKVDTHIKDSVNKYYGDLCPTSKTNFENYAFSQVWNSKNENFSPRAIDKLLYFACNTDFYFLEKFNTNPSFNVDSRKNQFLARLQELGRQAGHTFNNENAEPTNRSRLLTPPAPDTFQLKFTTYKNQIPNSYQRAGFETEISEHLKRGTSKDTILKALDKHSPETYQSSKGIFW